MFMCNAAFVANFGYQGWHDLSDTVFFLLFTPVLWSPDSGKGVGSVSQPFYTTRVTYSNMPSREGLRKVPESLYKTCLVCGRRLHYKNMYDHAFRHLLTVRLFYPGVPVVLSSPFSVSFNGCTYVSTSVLECPLVSAAWVTFKRRVRSIIAVMLMHVAQYTVRVPITDVAKAVGDVSLSTLVRTARPRTVTVGGVRYILYKENGDSFYYRRVPA